jgi:hypothetical protein
MVTHIVPASLFFLIFTKYLTTAKKMMKGPFIHYAAVILNMIRFPLFTCQVSLNEGR